MIGEGIPPALLPLTFMLFCSLCKHCATFPCYALMFFYGCSSRYVSNVLYDHNFTSSAGFIDARISPAGLRQENQTPQHEASTNEDAHNLIIVVGGYRGFSQACHLVHADCPYRSYITCRSLTQWAQSSTLRLDVLVICEAVR